MRILVYGMSSSGASYVTWMLGQRPGWICIPDLWITAPEYNVFRPEQNVILKVTVAADQELDDHVERFQPHKVILVRRDERMVRSSLSKKKYANYRGSIDQKLAHFNLCVATKIHLYDAIIDYESFAENMAKVPIKRSLHDIVQFNVEASWWCAHHARKLHKIYGKGGMHKAWSTGNIHPMRHSNYGEQ